MITAARIDSIAAQMRVAGTDGPDDMGHIIGCSRHGGYLVANAYRQLNNGESDATVTASLDALLAFGYRVGLADSEVSALYRMHGRKWKLPKVLLCAGIGVFAVSGWILAFWRA